MGMHARMLSHKVQTPHPRDDPRPHCNSTYDPTPTTHTSNVYSTCSLL